MKIQFDGLEQHFRYKFWEYPYTTFLEHKPGMASHEITNGNNSCSTCLTELALRGEEHNVCLLQQKRVVNCDSQRLARNVDIITAFYFPRVPGVQQIDIETRSMKGLETRSMKGPFTCVSWKSGYPLDPKPLSMILVECRAIPAIHVDWKHVLALCRHDGNPSRVNHDFPKEMHLDGITYERFEPEVPFVNCVICSVDIICPFFSKEFVYYTEGWYIPPNPRRELWDFTRYSPPTRPTHTMLPHQLEFPPPVEVGMPLDI